MVNNRRTFLKSASMGFGAVLTAPAFASSTMKAPNNNTLKVGVLLPTSNRYPEYSESFINGIQLVFERFAPEQLQFEPVTEIVKLGYGLQAVRKTEKLIAQNRVDTIIGLLNTHVAGMISEITGPAKIPAFIANAGENIPRKEITSNPYLFYSTLNLCRNAALAGKFMVEKFGKKVAVVSDLYDCGYDTTYAFRKAVEQSGGELTSLYINKGDDDAFYSNTIEAIKKDNSESVFLLMNGKEAASFFHSYQTNRMTLPLVTTSFVSDENQLPHLGASLDQVYHISSWLKNIDTPENNQFVKAYREANSTDPDQFAFLGYQTAKMLIEKFENLPNRINTESADKSIYQSRAYLCKTESRHFAQPENKIIDQLEIPDTIDFLTIDDKRDIHSGWLNPYLFV